VRTIGVVSVGRSDYGMCRPLLRRISDDDSLQLHLIVAGTHLSREFGFTKNWFLEDGFNIGDEIAITPDTSSPEAISRAMGRALIGYSDSFMRNRPDDRIPAFP